MSKEFMNRRGLARMAAIMVIGAIVTVCSCHTQDGQDNTPASLTGRWEVVSVEEDGVQIVSQGNGATIEFFADGTYETSGGCNEMMPNSYEIGSDSQLSIQVGGTKRKCAKDVVEFWDLGKVYMYEFVDNTLLLHYKTEGEVEGFFELQ